MNEDELRQKVSEKHKAAKLAAERRSLKNDAWLVDICPECGGEDIKKITPLFTHRDRSTCRKCGASHDFYWDY